MRCTTARVARSAADCWRAITDASLLPAWLPGVRRVRIVQVGADGLPIEVQFELAQSLTYSLVYSYDLPNLEVRWEPRMGKRDGVRGFARCEPEGDATVLTYGVEEGSARRPGDASLAEPVEIVAAFTSWVERGRPS